MMARIHERWPARFLLLAAMSMVIQTSCSHAPAPSNGIDPRDYEGENVIVRFLATDGVMYATSNYAVTDSTVVIRNVLRDSKYYNLASEAPYTQPPVLPPKDLALPLVVPMQNIRYMDRWEPLAISESKTKGTLLVVGIVAGFVAAVAIAVAKAND